MPPVTMLEAIRQAIFEEMERDPSVVTIGEDIGVYGGAFKVTAGLLERFGWERVMDTPISETAIIGAAVGMSYQGLRPIAELQFIDFIACCFNQITNFVAKSHYRWGAPVPMVMRGPSGGGVHGGPFHSANPEMYFVHTPGLKVIYPSTPYDAKGLLKSAIRDNNPVIYLHHYMLMLDKSPVPDGDYLVPFGVADIKRPGKDVTIVATAWMVKKSLLAAEMLAKEGISAEVIDPRTVAPLDVKTIVESVKKTGRLVLVDQAPRQSSAAVVIAGEIADQGFKYLKAPVKMVTALDTSVPYSEPMESFVLPSEQKIVDAVKSVLAVHAAAV